MRSRWSGSDGNERGRIGSTRADSWGWWRRSRVYQRLACRCDHPLAVGAEHDPHLLLIARIARMRVELDPQWTEPNRVGGSKVAREDRLDRCRRVRERVID